MRHLQRLPLVSALDIEPLIHLTAVENSLITTDILCDIVQRIDKLQSEFFALLVFQDGDFFNVTYRAKIMDTRDIKW
jgi:hypothetical protein